MAITKDQAARWGDTPARLSEDHLTVSMPTALKEEVLRAAGETGTSAWVRQAILDRLFREGGRQ